MVCQDFLAPKHIDPKFLDSKHVFKDVASLPTSITLPPALTLDGQPIAGPSHVPSTSTSAIHHAHANVFMPEKKRRQREGYADGDYTLFHKASAASFVRSPDPVGLLGTLNKIDFTSDEEKS